ncbi:MAG: S-layer homology domain-containing protein [Clostridia bacterium]|nr:S-layer homology domain-containing protein [Clostridia bacterium]
MKNKILSLVLALLMAASSASAVLADDVVAIDETAEEVAVVEEVEAGQYDKAIEFLANYGIFKGYDKNNTGAEDLIQRYQMALFVARIATGWTEDEVWEDGPENWSEFSDIDFAPVNSYYGALSFANQKGIIEGYGNGKFGPTDSITYQNALTMVVRTLGYTGLDWPWGYIQKAVELGLTDGITGVAYTDELTRGEVAQIVYNALFAKMKDGSNLGLKNFGIEFGWEKVVITASDRNSFTKLASDKGTGVDSKFVEFKLLEDDGTLADDAYLALAADFDLDTAKHEDDLAVGNAYYVLFEKDADSELAKIVAVESLLVDVIENEGKLNLTEDDEYPIQAFLADYTLVDKYTTNEYLNVTKSGKDEILVWNSVDGITEDVIDGYNIAIDWNTGDILSYVLDKKGNKVDADEDKLYDLEVKWYYNELLDKYYETVKDEEGVVVGINYMSDAEFEEFYKNAALKVSTSFKGFNSSTEIAKTAYATLEVFDTNLDGVADRALYESYKLGKFYNSTEKCGKCNADKASYVIESVNSLAINAAKNGNDGEDVKIATYEQIVEGACDHGVAFFVDGYTPVVDEDGAYVNGYVIYNADKETGAVKVVKNIGEDEDSYVATGVLRAYNVSKETLTIGEEELTMNYDELAGTGLYLVNKNAATKAAYTELLRDLFNQFVEYVVVDGEVVHIRAKSASTSKLIVVDSYAGIDKDGYIVVNGYLTTDLEYDQFRIANYNNWYGGDYFYYLDDAKAAASFTKGAIYAISSFDAEEDAYYVQLAGAFQDAEDAQGNEYLEYVVTNSQYVTLNDVTITEKADGYATVDIVDSDDPAVVVERKMSKDDKYVIITGKGVGEDNYARVIVYTGKLGDGWTVSGKIINTTDESAGLYVIVNATVTGFADTYKTGLALLLNDTYYALNADENLLGAYTGEVYAFDVLNGAFATYTATNKNLEVGRVFVAQDGVLVEDLGFETLSALVAETLTNIYANNTVSTAAYGFGKTTITAANYKNLFNVKDDNADEKMAYAAIEANTANFFEVSKFYSDLIGDFAVMGVEYDEDGEKVLDIDTELKVAEFEEIVEDYTDFAFNVYFVFNAETAKVVAYVDLVETSNMTEVVTGTTTNNVKVAGDADAYVEANVDYTATVVDGDITEVVINGINLNVDGYSVKDATHANVKANNWYFGLEGDCINENVAIGVTVDGEALLPVYECVVEKTYGDVSKCDVADGDCDLIKTVYVPVVASEVVDGKEVGAEVVVTDVAVPVEIVVTFGAATYTFSFDAYSDMPEGYEVFDGFKTIEADTVYAFVAEKAE